jgi:hypothetical protein
MALYVGRSVERGPTAFERVAFAWQGGELVIERTHGDALRLHVTIGSEHEEHELHLHADGVKGITTESKLIRIEDVPPSIPEAEAKKGNPAPVRGQSKLIKIEDIRASIPDATIVLS